MDYQLRKILSTILGLLCFQNLGIASEPPVCKTPCAPRQICRNTYTPAGPECAEIPAPAPLEFILPVDAKTEMVCTHSSSSGSHSGKNAYFALDLASPYEGRSATIRAAAAGKVFVFGKDVGGWCEEPDGTAARKKVSACGNSWGNRVKILHGEGYASFYVHLEKVFVIDGQSVKAGEAIGLEGSTGAAGHRHLHWSVQKIPGTNEKEWRERISWDGESVPFRFKAKHQGKVQSFDSSKMRCAHASIGEAPPQEQPRFRGL